MGDQIQLVYNLQVDALTCDDLVGALNLGIIVYLNNAKREGQRGDHRKKENYVRRYKQFKRAKQVLQREIIKNQEALVKPTIKGELSAG